MAAVRDARNVWKTWQHLVSIHGSLSLTTWTAFLKSILSILVDACRDFNGGVGSLITEYLDDTQLYACMDGTSPLVPWLCHGATLFIDVLKLLMLRDSKIGEWKLDPFLLSHLHTPLAFLPFEFPKIVFHYRQTYHCQWQRQIPTIAHDVVKFIVAAHTANLPWPPFSLGTATCPFLSLDPVQPTPCHSLLGFVSCVEFTNDIFQLDDGRIANLCGLFFPHDCVSPLVIDLFRRNMQELKSPFIPFTTQTSISHGAILWCNKFALSKVTWQHIYAEPDISFAFLFALIQSPLSLVNMLDSALVLPIFNIQSSLIDTSYQKSFFPL
jgi:hypothetical protein